MDRLIQTRIPEEAMKEIENRAQSKGLKVATWLRQLILQEIEPNKAGEPIQVSARCFGDALHKPDRLVHWKDSQGLYYQNCIICSMYFLESPQP